MNGRGSSIQSLLALRKLTRAITDVVRVQMTEYLKTLTPLMRPQALLGEYIHGGLKEPTRKADKIFKELQSSYEAVAGSKPFHLQRELNPPLDFPRVGLEITPLDYVHVVQAGSESRKIKVRCPLTWVLTYTDFPPNRLQELLETKGRDADEIQRFVLSYLVLHLVTTNEPGLMQLFEALHFPITTAKLPQFGDLPVTRIGIPITTMRPSDEVVIESAELTGMDAFEEVVNVEDIARLADPLKERLLDIARQQTPELV
jgi:hypothetical protein